MKVLVKVARIVGATDRATQFLSSQGVTFWLPTSAWEWSGLTRIVTTDKLMQGKDVSFKPLYHVPEPMEPTGEVVILDELRYKADDRA